MLDCMTPCDMTAKVLHARARDVRLESDCWNAEGAIRDYFHVAGAHHLGNADKSDNIGSAAVGWIWCGLNVCQMKKQTSAAQCSD